MSKHIADMNVEIFLVLRQKGNVVTIDIDVLSVSLQGDVGPAGPPGVPGSVVSHCWWDPSTHKVMELGHWKSSDF